LKTTILTSGLKKIRNRNLGVGVEGRCIRVEVVVVRVFRGMLFRERASVRHGITPETAVLLLRTPTAAAVIPGARGGTGATHAPRHLVPLRL